MLFALLLNAGCASSVVTETSGGLGGADPAPLEPSKSRWSFELPGDGKPNENKSIGPFCCTGQTAIVTDKGHDLAYGYFFDWKGQAYTNGTDSWMPDVFISVAGVEDINDPTSPLGKNSIAFDAGSIAAGSTKSAQAGDFLFTVTVEHVDVTPAPAIRMGTFAVRLDVDPAD